MFPGAPVRSVVTIQSPATSFQIPSVVDSYLPGDIIVVASGMTPIARLHGAYAQAGVGPAELATVVGGQLLTEAGLAADVVTDFAVAASVPYDGTTFLGTTIRNDLGLTGVTRPTHVNSLCTGGAAAIAQVIEALQRRGEGIGMALGADDQSLGRLALDNRFRAILERVTGQRLPMYFGLAHEAGDASHPFARFRIEPQHFIEAVRLFVERYGLVGSVTDGVLESFADPSGEAGYMWETAARVAEHFGVSDPEAIAIAAQSHRRYWAARDAGVFDGIVVTVPGVAIDGDENPVRNPNARFLGRGKTAPGVHSGTSSQMGGAGAGILLAHAETARTNGLPVLAEIVGYSFSNVPNEVMGLGPISASQGLLKALGLEMGAMDHIEVNEAFAGVVSAFVRTPEFGLLAGGRDFVLPAHVNPWGGAIAKGHVMGAKFLEMVTLGTRFFELNPDKQYVLCTLCGGGGQGAAMVLRNPHVSGARLSKRGVAMGSSFGFVQTHYSPVVEHLLGLGYLMTERNVGAITQAMEEIKRSGRPVPFPRDIDYVLARSPKQSLDIKDLLRRAADVALLRAAQPGSSPTIGEKIMVIGAGTSDKSMGWQIAYDYARAGYEVHLADVGIEEAERGREFIFAALYSAFNHEDPNKAALYSAEEAARILARIHLSGSSVETIARVQEEGGRFEMILEAATERLDIKMRIFEDLRAVADPHTILATNSSSLTAAQCGADAVFHYFNPVRAMAVIDGAVRDAYDADRRADIMGRLERVAFNCRKSFLRLEKDAPGMLVNPFFAATYFTADYLAEVEQRIAGMATTALGQVSDDEAGRKMREVLEALSSSPRAYALRLLEGLYVEAIRSKPQPLQELLGGPIDVRKDSALGRNLRRKGQGLFALTRATGGPRPYVEAGDNAAPYYGAHLRAPEALRQQLADWERTGSPDQWHWLPGMNEFEYDSEVRGTIAALQKVLGSAFVEELRSTFHRRFWARVMHLVGKMHDKGVIPETDPARMNHGAGLGLGWQAAPVAWLRAQPDLEGVIALIESAGLEVPDYFRRHRELSELAAIEAMGLRVSDDDRRATLTLRRPNKGNALSEVLIADLARHAQALRGNDAVSMVVLQGDGKTFCGGADVEYFYEIQRRAAELRAAGNEDGARRELARIHTEFAARQVEAMKTLGEGRRLRVAVVQGKNFGGGVEFAAQADIVIALESFEGEGTTFTMPEASLGIGVGLDGHVNLARRMGRAQAVRFLLTNHGGTLRSQEALQLGLVDRVVRRDELDSVLAGLQAAWEASSSSREDFRAEWAGERPAPSERLAALDRLWGDRANARVLAKGEVPPWLTGDERRLAESELAAIKLGSREAIGALLEMVSQGEAWDAEAGIVSIFGDERAEAAIAAFVGAAPKSAHPWPYDRATATAIERARGDRP